MLVQEEHALQITGHASHKFSFRTASVT